MSELNPELKRLMRCARQAPGPEPGPAPPVFCARVLARLGHDEHSSEPEFWQRAVWGSAWAAAALIVAELALLSIQQVRPSSFYHLPAPYQIVSAEFIP